MLLLSILITLTLGFSIVTAISTKFSILEKIGAAFLVGIGAQVFWMMLCDFVGIPITLVSVYIGSLLIWFGSWAYIITIRKTSVQEALWPYNPFENTAWSKINLPWMTIMAFVAYILWAVTSKCLFWPTFEFDSIAGYDLMAKVLAEEGTFNNSLFMSNGQSIFNTSHRVIYPPITAGSFAYAYMSGAALPKIMTSLFYSSLLIYFYAAMRRTGATHLNSAFTLLLMMLIPEMTSHAALSQTNIPQAAYTATGIISLYVWAKDKEGNAHFLWLSMILLAWNSIVRTENFIFNFVAGLLVLAYTLRNFNKKNIIRLVIFGISLLLPFVLWTLYLKINGLKPDVPAPMALDISYDADKFKQWWGYLWGFKDYPGGVVLNQNFYGLTSYLYFFLLFASSIYVGIRYYMNRGKELVKSNKMAYHHLILIYITLIPFIVYAIFYYFIDYNWDSIRFVMMYSFKRGIFGVMTLFCFFIGTNALVRLAFDWIGIFMYGKNPVDN